VASRASPQALLNPYQRIAPCSLTVGQQPQPLVGIEMGAWPSIAALSSRLAASFLWALLSVLRDLALRTSPLSALAQAVKSPQKGIKPSPFCLEAITKAAAVNSESRWGM